MSDRVLATRATAILLMTVFVSGGVSVLMFFMIFAPFEDDSGFVIPILLSLSFFLAAAASICLVRFLNTPAIRAELRQGKVYLYLKKNKTIELDIHEIKGVFVDTGLDGTMYNTKNGLLHINTARGFFKLKWVRNVYEAKNNFEGILRQFRRQD